MITRRYSNLIFCMLALALSTKGNADDGVFSLRSSGRVDGKQTNGISAWIQVGPGPDPLISVHVQIAPEVPLLVQPAVRTNGLAADVAGQKEWVFYLPPTNLPFGRLQLVDEDGVTVRAKTKVKQTLDAFPASFALAEIRSEEWRRRLKHNIYSGQAIPIPVRNRFRPVAVFHLNDHFHLEKSGTYQLTAWPILYACSSTNRALCYRVDLPPVTIHFDWRTKRQ